MASPQEKTTELARGLQTALDNIRDAELGLYDAVALCREAGWSWADIAKILGVRRQATWERFSKIEGMP